MDETLITITFIAHYLSHSYCIRSIHISILEKRMEIVPGSIIEWSKCLNISCELTLHIEWIRQNNCLLKLYFLHFWKILYGVKIKSFLELNS